MRQTNDSARTTDRRVTSFAEENPAMKPLTIRFAGTVLLALTVSTGAMAQYDRDMQCRQYADQATQPIRDQANSQAVGSTLLGAGMGAALGAAIGGGRGAGIGAASGAAAGAMGGAANSADPAGYIQQQYNAYYYQCMQQGQPAPAPGYAQPGYAQPGYAQPGYAQPGYAPAPYGYR